LFSVIDVDLLPLQNTNVLETGVISNVKI